MTTIKLSDRVKKIMTEWHAEVPACNKDVIKALKDFPIMQIVNACIDKMSATIRAQVLSACQEDVIKHINQIKGIQKDIILRQATLFSKLGFLDRLACEIAEELKNIEEVYNQKGTS